MGGQGEASEESWKRKNLLSHSQSQSVTMLKSKSFFCKFTTFTVPAFAETELKSKV